MKIMVTLVKPILALTGGLLLSSCQPHYLKVEPRHGTIPTGDYVYVDDGSCPQGQVNRVTGGSRTIERQYKCVPRRD